jgi:hypothetical protein
LKVVKNGTALFFGRLQLIVWLKNSMPEILIKRLSALFISVIFLYVSLAEIVMIMACFFNWLCLINLPKGGKNVSQFAILDHHMLLQLLVRMTGVIIIDDTGTSQ